MRAEISNVHILVDRTYQQALKHELQLRRLRDAGRLDDAQALAEAGPTHRGPTIPGRPHMILQPEASIRIVHYHNFPDFCQRLPNTTNIF